MIPVCEPTLGEKEEQYVLDAVRSGWISSSGKYLARFESEFSKKVGAKHGIGVCNGTVALHLALKAAGISDGDEVIVPSFTMVATANAIVYCGAKPVFVDADPSHWTIDVQALDKYLTAKTKAIISVTIYGHPSNFLAISEFCKIHDLKWIEDAAEGHGAKVNGLPLAAQPDLTVYSFYANKIITTGEGGMVCSNSEELADRCRYLKNLAFPMTGPRNYVHRDIGFNYRMTNIQAAIGCAQMEKFDHLVTARQNNAQFYRRELKELTHVIQLQQQEPWAESVYWMFGILLKDTVTLSRDEVMIRLKNLGFESRPFFYPMHLQPIFLNKPGLPVSERLGERGLYLPSSSHLSEETIVTVCNAVQTILL